MVSVTFTSLAGLLQQVGPPEGIARPVQTSLETATSQTDTAPSEELGVVRPREEASADGEQGSPKRAKLGGEV